MPMKCLAHGHLLQEPGAGVLSFTPNTLAQAKPLAYLMGISLSNSLLTIFEGSSSFQFQSILGIFVEESILWLPR